MSGVLSRVARFEKKRGRFRRFDWNLVNTSQGSGWEPVPVRSYEANLASHRTDVVENEITEVSFDADFSFPYHKDPTHGNLLIGGFCVLDRNQSYPDQRLS